MKLHFLGGASEIGASCTLVEIEGHRLLIDAGIRMGAAPGQELPNLAVLDDTGPPEEVLITHAHSDHTGALPALVPTLPANVPLRCTAPTRAIASVLLQDALKIMQQGEREGDLPLFAPEAVELSIARMQPVDYLRSTPLCGGALRATWIPAGHILGAASIYIEGERESLLMGGDVSVAQQQTIPGMVVPDGRPDAVVLESTYGNRRHADRSQQEAGLASQIEAVVAEGGKVLVPAFAVGRAQEVILILAQAMRRGVIAPFPVFVDGLVRKVNNVYASFPALLSPALRRRLGRGESPFYNDVLQPVNNPAEREQILNGPPCCIVASSGMLTGGASAFYAERLAATEENLIAITGYQDEESPGRALLNLARKDAPTRTLRINDKKVEVKCRVETYSLSAHADAGELAALVRRLSPQRVYLVHGDPEARKALATALDVFLPEGVHLPENGECCRLASSTGGGRRYGSTLRSGLGGERPFDEAALEELRTYLIETTARGPFRVQELAEMWFGTAQTTTSEIEACKEVLEAAQTAFVADFRRPYLFHLASEEEAASTTGPLEMNQARARIDQVFPPESGLFRCSTYRERSTFELAFHFPDVIRAQCAEQLQALEEEIRWTLKVRDTPHQERLLAEALAALPASARLRKGPALHLERREVAVEVESPEAAEADWSQQLEDGAAHFAKKTGYTLVVHSPPSPVLTTPNAPEPMPQDQPALGPRCEINQAYATIRKAFAEQPHAPYKVGCKQTADAAWIEVAFISPTVGAHYTDLLQKLGAETGWPIRIRPSVNQQQIAEEARQHTPESCHLLGTPRLFVAEAWVAVPVAQEPAAEEQADLKARFAERTGFEISWKVTEGRSGAGETA